MKANRAGLVVILWSRVVHSDSQLFSRVAAMIALIETLSCYRCRISRTLGICNHYTCVNTLHISNRTAHIMQQHNNLDERGSTSIRRQVPAVTERMAGQRQFTRSHRVGKVRRLPLVWKTDVVSVPAQSLYCVREAILHYEQLRRDVKSSIKNVFQ